MSRTPVEPARCESPSPSPADARWPLAERRTQQDRRQTDRQGKYDRRRNRCAHCRFFTAGTGTNPGQCQYHQIPMASEAFACPQFHPL